MLKQVLKIGLGISIVASSLLAAPEKTKFFRNTTAHVMILLLSDLLSFP